MNFFKKLTKKTRVAIIISAIGVISIFAVSFTASNDFKLVKSLDIYFTLFKELNLFYVDETDPEKLVEKSIESMLETLDPYTTYIPERDLDDLKFMTTGEYGGIGSLIRKSGDYAVITDPYENFPAQKSGLRAGDEIMEINGETTKGKDVSNVSSMLKGTPGTDLTLTVRRINVPEPLKITLKREKIQIPSVPYYGLIGDSIGYISLNGFTLGASNEVRNALINLKKQNARSIILDIRGNPGGILEEAVRISNLFVGKGLEIVSTKGKLKQNDRKYLTNNEPVDTIIPLVVLVSRGSASASEIVAGAIQDLDRGVVVGQRTFGKGLVQQTRPLIYNTQLKVTTAKYYIPSGRCIQALDYTHRNEDGSVGIIPDSLITAFKTKNGRTVYDGGGINPDLKVEPELLSNISISLYAKNYIFDFATKYAASKPSIASAKTFKLTDAEYTEFVNSLEGKSFDYETRSEEQLKKLISDAKKEKYYSAAQVEFEALTKKLAHDKYKDLDMFKPEIKELLEEEILSRYFYQKGRIEKALVSDAEIAKGIEVLRNKAVYQSILKGTYKESIQTAKRD